MVSGVVLLALTAAASAGPTSVTTSKLITPSQAQTEPVAYRYYHHRHNGGAALGLEALPALTTGGWPYYDAYYESPYAYYGGPYGLDVGRSIGYKHLHGGAHK